ncbi:Uncharacterised protein [Zhongshania aliphaticivorans]|uniref:Uracil-DNA glycosylase-like domain-containing protein n=1 Tax=Zhongshania aliphaticivorans TaxID=1470434 RepID=A0A5S9MRT0_9GAMM|nr:hypothetical protein [Zhongshania aliphaticivorans]CAA0079865.1 Uncharacterised protein [Zhongshania aliphaticivorans]CAA0085942.1 Uncharacterised protein [Zhongshania aliphaticivorans]
MEKNEAVNLWEAAKSQLSEKYFQILEDHCMLDIYTVKGHSGVFLSSPPIAFFLAKKRVMVVGREPMGWRDASCPYKLGKDTDINSINSSMRVANKFDLEKKSRSWFKRFYFKVSSEVGGVENSAVWSNLFCVSFKKGSPLKSPAFESIKFISQKLLSAQIEVLKPDVIFFACGYTGDSFIKEVFELTESEVLIPRLLWRFKIDGIQCFRTSHPRWLPGREARKQAIQLAIV